MKKLLISACLLGFECKYCGGSNALDADIIKTLREKYVLYPVCPEVAGGLSVPRDPSERLKGAVVSCKGADVTAQFSKGAETAVTLARRFGCESALLKELSPSCGSGKIYDGHFSHCVIEGDGLTAERLKNEGIEVFGESELRQHRTIASSALCGKYTP